LILLIIGGLFEVGFVFRQSQRNFWSGINLLDVGFFNLPHFKYAFTLATQELPIELRMQYGRVHEKTPTTFLSR
jgi:hypothetical protein